MIIRTKSLHDGQADILRIAVLQESLISMAVYQQISAELCALFHDLNIASAMNMKLTESFRILKFSWPKFHVNHVWVVLYTAY